LNPPFIPPYQGGIKGGFLLSFAFPSLLTSIQLNNFSISPEHRILPFHHVNLTIVSPAIFDITIAENNPVTITKTNEPAEEHW
jgi:hypothetical protein